VDEGLAGNADFGDAAAAKTPAQTDSEAVTSKPDLHHKSVASNVIVFLGDHLDLAVNELYEP
jgi:hypothetical protein